MWTRLAALIRERLLFAWLAGGGFWLAWFVSLAIGGGRHDAAGHRIGADHVQYYVVGQLLAEGRAPSVYDKETMTERQKEIGGPEWKGYLPFRYPPFYALAFAPTSRLTYEASFVVWTVIGLICVVASGWLLIRLPRIPKTPSGATLSRPPDSGIAAREANAFGQPGERHAPPAGDAVRITGGLTPRRSPRHGGLTPRRSPLSVLLAALCFYPVFAAISYGQNSLVSLLLISATAALWLRERMLLAGLVAGLLLFKPPLVVGIGLLFLLDARRSWQALLGMTLTALALASTAWLALPEMTQAFLDSLTGNVAMQEQARTGLAPLYSSQGFWQLLLSKHLDFISNPLALLTSVVALIAFVVLWWRWRAHRPFLFALAVLMTPWLSPYTMVYDWSILLVPGVLLYGQIDRDRWLVLAAALWIVAFVSGPLVRAQLVVSPVALQLSMPVLIACVLALGRPDVERESRVSA